uniref:G-protein coupled receptors family 1 profile domain-containing protein n=1 Tax=Glossina pallidipes TaxID=7398 RepID=A0A1A9ZTM0_GLOPL
MESLQEEFVPSLHGVGLCILNLMDDMHEYMRGLFFLMYCAPTVLLAYIYIRTSQALRPPDGPLSEYRAVVRMRQRNSSASSVERSYSNATTATVGGGAIAGAGGGADAGDGVCAGIGHHYTYSTGTATRSYDLYHAELDVYHEKRNQRNFGSMAAAQVICVCPLMILRFARLSIEENYENQKHFDFIYLMFVWIAFLPTIIFPFIYATQLLPRTQQQRICGYFRLFTKHFPKKSTKTLVDVNTASSRENSFEKDESTNISQGTCIVLNDDGFMGETVGDSSDRRALKKKLSETKLLKCQRRSDVKNVNNRSKKSLSRQSYEEVKNVNERIKSSFGSNVNNFSDALSHKREKLKTQLSQDSNEVKINIISDVISKSSAMQRHNKANTSGCSNGLAAKQRRLKTLDNCSSMSSSTYCNGNGSLVNNFDSNHFGDNENSSMVNGMVVQIGSEGGSIGLPPYHEGKMPCYAEVLKTPDLSSSDISYNLSRMNSSSNFENELDTIDLLELERNRIDMQELLEKQGKTIRERRRLPDIDKLCQRSPKFRSLAASTITLSANMSVFSDPLQTSSETLGTSSTLNGETSSVSSHVIPLDSDKFELYSRSTIINEHSLDEGISGDFHDDYKPGDAKHAVPDSALPASSPVQYQYTRRLSRKPSHHQQHISANMSSHRLSKRDSFHSIHNNDLIAGAFGEIDPTQPLTKMSIIDNRMLMRRSSGVGGVGGGSGGNSRASGFSSPNRSSTKSRDYNHGSTHSPQPELDFRENIFAEL